MVRERFVEMPHQLWQQIHDVGPHDVFVLHGSEMGRDRPRVHELVESVLVEPDRHGDHGARARLHHRGDNGARVDAAGQERPERHIADQTHSHRFGHEGIQPIEIFLFAGRIAVTGERQIPVPANRDAAVLGHQVMRRRQLPHRSIDRLRRRHVLQRKICIQRFGAPVAGHGRILENRLHLGAKAHAQRRDGVIQGLDADPIPHEQQAALRLVPQRIREHAAEPIDGAVAPLFVRVHDHFCVRMRAEPVSVRDQLCTQLGEVVNLAVEHDADRPVLVRQRLIAGRQIDDAQTAVPEPDAGADVEAVRIGTAMRDDVSHRDQALAIDRLRRREIERASDAAHVRRLPAEEKHPRHRDKRHHPPG